jgi:hypothetical protein
MLLIGKKMAGKKMKTTDEHLMYADSTGGNGVNSDKSRAGGGDGKAKEGHFLCANFANTQRFRDRESNGKIIRQDHRI